MSDADRDQDYHAGLAQALGEVKLRVFDRRFLFLFVFVVVGMTLMFTVLQVQVGHVKETQRQAKLNCDTQNDVLQLLAQASLANATRTPAENTVRANVYLSKQAPCS